MITVTRVHVSLGNVQLFGTALIDRCVNFMNAYGVTGNPDYLWQGIAIGLCHDSPSMLGLVVLDDDDNVVGHLLAEAQNQHGITVVMVTQAELDERKDLQKGMMVKRAWKLVEHWADAIGARKIMCWAIDDRRAGIFGKLGLKKLDYVIMEQMVQPEVDNG